MKGTKFRAHHNSRCRAVNCVNISIPSLGVKVIP